MPLDTTPLDALVEAPADPQAAPHTGPQPPEHPDFVLVAFGSAGDILPIAAMALALQARGHRVWFLAPAPFETPARALSLQFFPILDETDAQALMSHPRLWHPRHGFEVMWPYILKASQATVKWLEPLAAASARPCLVGGTMALGARVAHERWRWPQATVHISPCWIFAGAKPPVFYGLGWLKWLPPRWRSQLRKLADVHLVDGVCAANLNHWRASYGLSPVSRVLTQWAPSPQLMLGLFPPWFSKPQAGWPPHLQLHGFLRDDGGAGWVMPPKLALFLKQPGPTILFTAGSAMLQAGRFFKNAAAASQRMGFKALLLAPDSVQSARWPAHVHVETYAPISQLLPHCSAMVSHAGIGTIAQGMAAGVPQLITAYAFDQFDNARKAADLGVARILPRSASAGRLVSELKALLADTALLAACQQAQQRLQAETTGLTSCCKSLEALRSAACASDA